MSEEKAPQAWLTDETGRRTDIIRTVTVGRAPANAMVILDPEHRVSQYHAWLEQDGRGRVFVEDRHSTNGTFVNENKIVRKELADGDRIRFGSKAVYIFRRTPAAGVNPAEGTVLGVTDRAYEERECWFVIGDVKASSQLLTRIGNQPFSKLITEWSTRCLAITEENGGVMTAGTGDGWLLLWYATPGSEARVGAAIRAFQKLQRAGEPDFRVCIHRGLAILGGGAKAGEDTVVSAELHQAFRMEKIAARLAQNVVASEAATLELQKILPCTLLPGEFELKGFAGMHRFYRVD